ncbi:MAG TPA: hypothetical protein VGM17_07345 [Rhizomicrobium sp.]|jgi:hypothetical protein
MMLQSEKINQIAQSAATQNLGAKAVRRATSEPTIDSKGHDALRITIVVDRKDFPRFAGDSILNTLYQIQTRLLEQGEERPAIIEYATDEELKESADSKS